MVRASRQDDQAEHLTDIDKGGNGTDLLLGRGEAAAYPSLEIVRKERGDPDDAFVLEEARHQTLPRSVFHSFCPQPSPGA